MTVVGNLSNIVFNYIFIIRLQMAAAGAGLATRWPSTSCSPWASHLFAAQGEREPWSLPQMLDRRRLGALIRLNRDILVRTLCLVTAFALFTNYSSILGTAVLAANSILLRVLLLAAYLIDGAAYAAESMAGILLGRRDSAGLRRLSRLALASGAAFAVLVLAAVFAAPRFMLGTLTSHQDLVELSLRYAPWLIPTLLLRRAGLHVRRPLSWG